MTSINQDTARIKYAGFDVRGNGPWALKCTTSRTITLFETKREATEASHARCSAGACGAMEVSRIRVHFVERVSEPKPRPASIENFYSYDVTKQTAATA